MTITRLRPAHSPETLAAMYPQPHDHRRWGLGHHLRVEMTITLANGVIPPHHRHRVGDLSCGNAEIANRIVAKDQTHLMELGDFAAGYRYHGPIEETVTHMGQVNTYICSETLEHLDDPHLVLRLVRGKTRFLLLTTPLDCWEDSNAEHYWAWDREGVESVLAESGFRAVAFASLDSRTWGEPYLYGIWVAL